MPIRNRIASASVAVGATLGLFSCGAAPTISPESSGTSLLLPRSSSAGTVIPPLPTHPRPTGTESLTVRRPPNDYEAEPCQTTQTPLPPDQEIFLRRPGGPYTSAREISQDYPLIVLATVRDVSPGLVFRPKGAPPDGVGWFQWASTPVSFVIDKTLVGSIAPGTLHAVVGGCMAPSSMPVTTPGARVVLFLNEVPTDIGAGQERQGTHGVGEYLAVDATGHLREAPSSYGGHTRATFLVGMPVDQAVALPWT